MDLAAAVYYILKTLVSISVPSIFVTVQVKAPQFALKLLSLVAAESVQLRTVAASLTLYVKAGEANLNVSIDKVSVRHGLMTTMVKFYVSHIVDKPDSA